MRRLPPAQVHRSRRIEVGDPSAATIDGSSTSQAGISTNPRRRRFSPATVQDLNALAFIIDLLSLRLGCGV